VKPIIAWFVDNPVAANLLMAVLVVAGLLSLASLRQEEFPQVDLEVVQVTVSYLGATPQEVEEGVCIRIEEALEGTENVFRMTSTASEGSCSVMLELESGSDTFQALNDIKSKVDGINTFPAETERPVVSQLTTVSEVMSIVISGNAEERTLKTLAQEMREDLVALEGVSQVSVEYVRPDEISIEVSESTLRRHGLTLQAVADAVRRSSLDMPGGSIRAEGGEILVRTAGQLYRGTAFEDIVVVTRADGTAVTLGEIANVVDGFEEGDLSVRFDGEPAAMVRVYRVGREDAIESARKVKAYLEEAGALVPEGITLSIWLDESEQLRARLNTLFATAVSGLALVLLALALPLRFRLAMWVAAGIPIALLGAVATFGLFDITLNSLTVMGFILVLGIVVDDAIVVGERVYAHERHAEDQRTAAINGTHEVAVPVIFGVLTTMAAFVPIIFVPGRMGAFFSVVGYVVVICLVFSIIESQLILPSHLSHRRVRSRGGHPNRAVAGWLRFQSRLSSGLESFAERNYGGLLRKALEWRYTVLAAGIGVLVLMLALVVSGRIGFQFMPPIEGDRVYASLTMPQGIPVEETARAAERIERAALELKRELEGDRSGSVVQHILTSIGRSAGRGGRPGGNVVAQPVVSHEAEVAMALVPLRERGGLSSTEVARRWRELTGLVPDSVDLTFSADVFSAGDPISVELRGRDVDLLREAAALVRAELGRFNGVTDISDSFRAGKQEVQLSLRPEARNLNLTLNDLGRQVRQAFYGEEAQRIQRGTEDVRVMVRYPEDERRSLGDLEDMRIRTADLAEVPFAAVADVSLGSGYSNIRRVNRQRVVTVTADVDRGVTTPEAVIASLRADVLPRVLAGYRGVSYRMSGEQEERAQSFAGLAALVPLALLMIYAILAIPLRSYLQPLVIMSVIPFGAVGAIIGHMIMGWPLILPSLLGIIALSGVVVNASLVLVDFINRQRRLGMPVTQAVERAGVVRFRPVLLTSATTFLGLLPLMLLDSPGTAFIVPMAISLAWGVLFATVLTLFLVPCLYRILEDMHVWRSPRAGKLEPGTEPRPASSW
jgi:multidrug efflux pump subunit AcrB